MPKKKKGFTLIELLVVIAIVGLLSTLATVAARYAIEKAKIAKAQHATDSIYNAITMLGNDTSQWPGHQTMNAINSAHVEICGPDAAAANCGAHTIDSGFAGIIANDTVTPFNNWAGSYMVVIASDPWGHQYFFDTNYSINAGGLPCACGSDANVHCHNVVAVGSYGPDGLGAGALVSGNSTDSCDDITKIIIFD